MITTLQGTRLRRRTHLRLARGGFLYEDESVEHPRLVRTTGRATSRDPVTATWSVDGEPVDGLDEALRRLAAPPVGRDLFA